MWKTIVNERSNTPSNVSYHGDDQYIASCCSNIGIWSIGISDFKITKPEHDHLYKDHKDIHSD